MRNTRPLIAVIDDNLPVIELINEVLADAGYATIGFTESSAQVYQAIRLQHPDLIILDLRLQQPDTGLQVFELLRQDPDTQHIPIIICTADMQFIAAAGERYRDGTTDILAKPFELDTLLALVHKHARIPPQVA